MGKAKPVDVLAKARSSPKSVKHLSLNPAALGHANILWEPTAAFPMEVLACTNLESLDLFRGIAWDGDNSIPAGIGKLVKLRELTLGGLSMTELPDAIGKLKALRVLSLDYAESLESLPKSIGNLAHLEELTMSYTPALTALPKEIGKLGKLKTLSLGESGITKIPTELWDARSLVALALPDAVTTLPLGISKLASLESITLSAPALVSIASELPKLKKLHTVYVVQGEKGDLPDAIGELPKLKMLHASFAGLKALPASLAGHAALESLDVAGNQLKSLEALVASLPKLKELDFSDNPIDRGEKRRIDAMMRLPPSKRKTNAPTPKPTGVRAEYLGDVVSVNASLLMLVADATIAKAWRGCEEGDSDESDFDRLLSAMDDDDVAKIQVGGKEALGLSLAVGQGVVRVFRSGKSLVLVEGFIDRDKDPTFLEDMALPPGKNATRAGQLRITSGNIVFMPSTDDASDVASHAKKPAKKPIECGSEESGLLVPLASGTYAVVLEDEQNASWGTARRALLVPK
jgi:Leucine-rich repeat (LRR) protein